MHVVEHQPALELLVQDLADGSREGVSAATIVEELTGTARPLPGRFTA